MIFRIDTRCLRSLITILGVALLAVGSLSAQAIGPEIPIFVDPIGSYQPAVAFNIIHEEFLVVWWNDRGPNSLDVYARRVGLDGSLGSWFAIAADPGEKHYDPVVAYNPLRDEYLVVWATEYAVNDDDLWGSIVSWNGGTIGSRFAISNEVDDQERTVVVFNPNHDEYLVVFQNSWSGGGNDVAAQRVGGDGSLLSWASIAAGGTTFRGHPTAAYHPGLDQYLIAYTLADAPTWYPQVRGKVAASDLAGVSTAPEVVIFDNPSDLAISPAVAAGGGGYIAQFTLPITPYAIRLGSDGLPVGSTNPFQLGVAVGNTATTPTRANAVAVTETVGYVSLWHDILDSDGDVHARVVSPFADSLLTEQLPVAVGPGREDQVALACAPWGTCLAAYQHDGNVVGRVLRFNLFGDGFESGDFTAWPVHLP